MTGYTAPLVKSAFGVLVFVAAARSATIDSVSFGQLDWYDGTGALYGPNSLWGAFDYHTTPDPTDYYYINMVARNGGTGSGSWVVQNQPIFPSAVSNATDQEVYFDLSELGISDGTRLPSLDYYVTVDANPLDVTPAGTFSTALVPTVEHRSNDGAVPIVGSPGAPMGHKASGPVTFAGKDHDFEVVEEALNQCLAGAFGRSIKWLDKEYDLPNLPNSTTAQEVHDFLARIFTGNKDAPKISFKANALKAWDPRATTKIVDLMDLGPVSGTITQTPENVILWIDNEMKTEDVELSYKKDKDNAHIVALTKIYYQRGNFFLSYREDTKQGEKGGESPEKNGIIKCKGNDCSFDRFPIQYLVSESVVPEPPALMLMAIAGIAGIANFEFRRSRMMS